MTSCKFLSSHSSVFQDSVFPRHDDVLLHNKFLMFQSPPRSLQMKGKHSFNMLLAHYPVTWCHIPEQKNPQVYIHFPMSLTLLSITRKLKKWLHTILDSSF